MRKLSAAAIVLIASALTLTLLSSFGSAPTRVAQRALWHAHSRSLLPGIKVEVSALGASESRQFFGENIAEHNVQPVWLSIENETDDQFVFLPIAMDPDYYSPYEVSYRFHGAFSLAARTARARSSFSNSKLQVFFRLTQKRQGLCMASSTPASSTPMSLFRTTRVKNYNFALPVPGPEFVGTNIAGPDRSYPGKNIEDLELGSLRTTFAGQGCCTTNGDGTTRRRSAANIVIVESNRDPIVPFIARDWHLARQLDVASAIETVRAFLRDEFLTSPVDPALRIWSQGRRCCTKGTVDDKRTRSRSVMAYAVHI